MAAGESRRLDTPKQLLRWQGEYFINHAISVAGESALDQVVVVLGCHAEKIQAVIHDADVGILRNDEWKSGLGSSIRAGILAMGKEIDAAIILLADQPFVTSELINTLIEEATNTSVEVVATRVDGVQCNPVLFKQHLFQKLARLSGDRGAKMMLSDHKVKWVDWKDVRVLIDIDTPQDYAKALASLAHGSGSDFESAAESNGSFR